MATTCTPSCRSKRPWTIVTSSRCFDWKNGCSCSNRARIPFVARCKALCATFQGWAESPCPPPGLERSAGHFAEEQEKLLGSCDPRQRHNCPQCGQFQGVDDGVPKTNFFSLGRCSGIKPTNCKMFQGVPTNKEVSKYGNRKREVCPLDHAGG